MNYLEVIKVLMKNKGRKYPSKLDARYWDNFIIPNFTPKFGIDFSKANSVFTIGSCFARNLEELLMPLGVNLPTTKFSVPIEERVGPRSNRLLNEYNPGSICQKIFSTLDKKRDSELTLYNHDGVIHDLLLPPANGVEFQRAIERRNEIAKVYDNLILSEIVIITLGYVEAWYDQESMSWLNRMPPYNKKEDARRFSFRRLDVFECMPMLSEALDALSSKNKKIILTVSPVPINTTMTNSDCIIANEFSKSVLRVCAERLSKSIKNVDYYPSYEMVKTSGLSCFDVDNIHVLDSVVGKITTHMISKYLEALEH